MQPTVGRTVHYRLDTKDMEYLVDERPTAALLCAAGDVLPAVITRVHRDTVDLVVTLPGASLLWSPGCIHHAIDPGSWFWPPRVDMTREGK